MEQPNTMLNTAKDVCLIYENGIPYLIQRGSDNETNRYFNMEGKEVDYSTVYPAQPEDTSNNLFTTTDNNVDVINEIKNYLEKHVYFNNKSESVLVSLLIMLSYCVNFFERIPYLWIKGVKGSGKTTLMTVMKSLVYRPLFLSDTTASALFRTVDLTKPTLFLDEVEVLNKRNSNNDLIFRVLNSGYQKDGCVTRFTSKGVTRFSTFGFKIIAGINRLLDTLEDRCIPLMLSKPSGSTIPEVFSGENPEITTPLVGMIHSSLRKICPNLKQYYNNPELLGIDPKISLREFDKWFPILILAKLLSSDTHNYFEEVQQYALSVILQKEKAETFLPENVCKGILKDFLDDKSAKTRIADANYFYFKTDEIQRVILATDPHNTYRNKAEITMTLKKIGVETDRRRFGNGPVSLYKIPKSILN